VVDELTEKIPFDTHFINRHTYSGRLHHYWEMESQIANLARHIIDAANNASGMNSIWRFFGVTSGPATPNDNPNDKDKLDLIIQTLSRISQETTQRPQLQNFDESLSHEIRPILTSSVAVITDQKIDSANGFCQKGYLDITIVRDVYTATGSGKFTPRMVDIPTVYTELVAFPNGVDINTVNHQPGTGTTFDFNIGLKSRVLGRCLPRGTYRFKYMADAQPIAQDPPGGNFSSQKG
jgi:hypothetical protein